MAATAGNDYIEGTPADESFDAGQGNDTIEGHGGSDTFHAGPGDDVYYGGFGIDTVIYSSARTDVRPQWYQISDGEANYTFLFSTDATIGGEGRDSLHDIDRLEFKDGEGLAFDLGTLSGQNNAGVAAKLGATIFGTDRLWHDEAGVGLILALLDRGMSPLALAAAAFDYLGISQPSDVVQLLWGNVVGTPIDNESFQYFTGLLEGGMTASDLAVRASNTAYVTERVGLTGAQSFETSLAGTGLRYRHVDLPPLPPTAAAITQWISTTEGSTLTHTVLLSRPTTETISLPFTLASDPPGGPEWSGITATQGVVVADGQFIIGPGIQTFGMTIQTVDDSIDSPDGFLVFRFGNGVGADDLVLDNDGPVFVRSASQPTCVEGEAVGAVVVLSGAAQVPTHFGFSTQATFSTDVRFTSVAASDGVVINGADLWVPAGVISFSLVFQTVDDSVYQGNPSFFRYSVTNAYGSVGAAIEIVDNDPSVGAQERFFPFHSDKYGDLGQYLRDDTLEGPLGIEALRASIIGATNELDYWKLFSVDRVAGPHDATWTTEEMGNGAYGNLPATAAVLESLVLGGAVMLMKAYTAEDRHTLATFVQDHRPALLAGDLETVDAYMYQVWQLTDYPYSVGTDANIALNLVVPFFAHLVEMVGMGQQVSILQMLPLGWT
ncbi:MAG: Hemolysin-type calcium-binding protein [Ramlibacter sp.]|nr:Hemolysin-type calcium-binding protein [Ramlibacter sp.]